MEPRQSGGHSLAAPSRRRRHEWWQASERHALKIHLLPSKRPQGFAPKHATAQECNARGLIVAFLLLAFDRQIDLGSPRAPPPRRDATRLYRTPTRAADPYCSRYG